MPHVKGNKFKKAEEQRTKDAAAPPKVEPAVPTNLAVAAGQPADTDVAERRPAKRQRMQQQQQTQPLLLEVPTVVAPAPKPGVQPTVAAAVASSNWAVLKAALDAAKSQQQAGSAPWRRRQKEKAHASGAMTASGTAVQAAVPTNRPHSIGSSTEATKVVALDCEMVGVGPGGQRSALARVCIVNSAGNVLVDRFVRPKEKVTDFRTKVSGVRPSDLREAASFEEVQRQVSDLLQSRILVGHAIDNDLEALLLNHHRKTVRDTAKYPPLMKAQARTGKLKPRALRHLAAEQLGLTIQEGEHSPVDDARVALYLYLRHRKEWEQWVAAGGDRKRAGGTGSSSLGQNRPSLEELAKRDYMADL